MNPDCNPKRLCDLTAVIEDSLQADRPPQWRAAFAAADDKLTKQTLLDQLKQKFGLDGSAVADAGNVQPDAAGGAATQVASDGASNGFANLLRGWLGRA
jgi:hypothetical protein